MILLIRFSFGVCPQEGVVTFGGWSLSMSHMTDLVICSWDTELKGCLT